MKVGRVFKEVFFSSTKEFQKKTRHVLFQFVSFCSSFSLLLFSIFICKSAMVNDKILL